MLFHLPMSRKSPLKILITAPSLAESKNVSGISTVVRQIIENASFEYKHFAAGRQDDERQNANWIFRQTALPFRFYLTIKRHKIDVVHINTAFNPLSILRDFALTEAARRAGKPVLLHIHGGKFLAREFEKDWLKRIAEKMLREANAILVLSDLEKEIIENRWQNLHVEVLENAVATDNFPAIKKQKNSLIFLGRLHESKGLNEIIEAVCALKNENLDFTFRAFGAGGEQEFFVSEMTEILGERFFFGGVIGGKEKRKQLAQSDIFILPSRYGEGLPMAMLEAMAAKCVVVVSEMASTGAVVRDGVNGFLVEPGNVSQLIEKLRRVLSDDSNFADLRENARRTVEAKFNLCSYIKRLENIYRKIPR